MNSDLPCKHCGQPRDAHHEYAHERQRPAGCVCDPGTWEGPITCICAEHVGDVEYCTRCEHDRACHGQEVKP